MPVSGTMYRETMTLVIESVLSNYIEEKAAAVAWALHILAYKECKSRLKLPIFPLTYQQILKDPVGTTARLLEHSKASSKHAGLVTEAMKRDSQQGSFLSKEETKKKKRAANFSKEEITIMEDVLKQLDLPSLDQYEKMLDL